MADVHRSVQALSLLGAVPPEYVRSVHERPGNTNFCAGSGSEEAPVLDMSQPRCGARMANAATKWGFFQVINHGVPAATMAEMQRVGHDFFALPQGEKERYATDPTSGRIEGYGVGTKASRNLEEGKKLWADFFYHYVAPAAMVNHDIWPKNPAGYREANEEYARHMLRLTREMLEHLSVGLGLEKGAMREAFGGDDLVLLQKINSYPPCPQPGLILGIGQHTDMGTLTVLLPNEVQGLQIFKDDRWYDVKYVPEALIVLIGDQIEILSNGRYKAGTHRATVNKEKTQMSWPVFVEPPGEVVVGPHRQLTTDDSPAKYKAKKYKDYQYCKINLLPQ
uniref:anthocyanidin synthase n=1 Tax=Arundo donax TaxID=35708 RepID=A0A0A9DR45_ARUDO